MRKVAVNRASVALLAVLATVTLVLATVTLVVAVMTMGGCEQAYHGSPPGIMFIRGSSVSRARLNSSQVTYDFDGDGQADTLYLQSKEPLRERRPEVSREDDNAAVWLLESQYHWSWWPPPWRSRRWGVVACLKKDEHGPVGVRVELDHDVPRLLALYSDGRVIAYERASSCPTGPDASPCEVYLGNQYRR